MAAWYFIQETKSMENLNLPLLAGLKKYQEENILRFHMPGHYGRLLAPYQEFCQNIFALDVTEVEGTDNLAQPTGILKESMENIAGVYHAQKSYYLVNGSTAGMQVAIDSLVPDGGAVLVARNAHKSIHNILQKKNIHPLYVYPEIDENFGVDHIFTLEEIKKLCSAQVDAVVLAYPNYYGKIYDLQSIYQYLQEKGIPLIVDAAHAAHFEFSPDLPPSPVAYSDVCVMSLHKTLPAFTQCSVLHLGKNIQAHQIKNIEDNLSKYQSSSPSYLLMGSGELSVAIMDTSGRQDLQHLQGLRQQAKARLQADPRIQVYENEDFCKLFVQTPLEGEKLDQILRKRYKIQAEMTIGRGILFMFGISHTEEDLKRLVQALLEIVSSLPPDQEEGRKVPALMFPRLEAIPLDLQKEIKKQKYRKKNKYPLRKTNLEKAEGRVMAEDITPYPPGIPIIKEFEILNQEALITLKTFGYQEVCYYEGIFFNEK